MLSHSLYALFRHVPAPLDLLDVRTTDQHVFAFLVLNWGFFADVDIESERLRALGSLRFPIYALDRIIRAPMSSSVPFRSPLQCSKARGELIARAEPIAYSLFLYSFPFCSLLIPIPLPRISLLICSIHTWSLPQPNRDGIRMC